MRIHQLPAAIANQIAAGEVIERPASVVKELLENSFDAGADAITIEVGYGGLNQIKISDNGSGIMADDLPLALAAHATSKIKSLDDLYAINSMGFRGEALASIASIAKVTISSRPPQQDHAMMLSAKNGELNLQPCARAIGTTIDVRDIFFNAPVRKRFLKSEKIEFQAIEAVVKRFALAAPHIAITLKHNGKVTLSLASARSDQDKLARMGKIFGTAFMHDAIFLDVEGGGMHLYGWISGPAFQRSQNDRQWVYINQRMVKDKLLNHALKQAYDGHLHPGRFPACLLYLTINTGEVDVNVHPTKHEVRFQQPRLIHDFFTSQLVKALSSQHQSDDEQCSAPATLLHEPVYYQANDVAYSPAQEQVPQPFIAYDTPQKTFSDLQSRAVSRPQQITNNQSAREDQLPWTILNHRYALVFLQQVPHIIDVITLYKQTVEQELSQQPLPLKSRPLLVPISYSISAPLSEQAQLLLAESGIKVTLHDQANMHLCTVPISVPYLDLRLFMDSVMSHQELNSTLVRTLLCTAQHFNAGQLTLDERMNLNKWLQNEVNPYVESPCIRALTEDACQMILNDA